MYRATITYEDTTIRGAGVPSEMRVLTINGTYDEVVKRAGQMGRLPNTVVVSMAVMRG